MSPFVFFMGTVFGMALMALMDLYLGDKDEPRGPLSV